MKFRLLVWNLSISFVTEVSPSIVTSLSFILSRKFRLRSWRHHSLHLDAIIQFDVYGIRFARFFIEMFIHLFGVTPLLLCKFRLACFASCKFRLTLLKVGSGFRFALRCCLLGVGFAVAVAVGFAVAVAFAFCLLLLLVLLLPFSFRWLLCKNSLLGSVGVSPPCSR